MKVMTFREFQNSGRVMRLAEVPGYGDDLAADSKVTGVQYEGGFVIEDVLSWPYAEHLGPHYRRWHLILGNQVFASDDRADLEEKLYGHAVAVGCFDAPAVARTPTRTR